MKIKNTSVRLATVVLVLAGGLPLTAVADKEVKMDLCFAGAFISGALPSSLIHVTAVGSPGRAEIRGSGASGYAPIPVVTFDCLGSSGLFLSIIATEDPLIFTFQDLSLLFANGSGEICVDLISGLSEFEFNIMFIGGRGRFEGATGQAVIRGEAERVSNDGSFQGETGTIVGWINLP